MKAHEDQAMSMLRNKQKNQPKLFFTFNRFT